MQHLNLPAYDLKLKQSVQQSLIYDTIRRKYIVLTPEEWVRQHFINYLVYHLGYPKGLLAIERGMSYNQMAKRTDICVFGLDGRPQMLVECKAASIPITAEVIKQASSYNKSIKAPYVVLTNGMEHFCWKVDLAASGIQPLDCIPAYQELNEII